MRINSHNEWDPLKEIVVGHADSTACLMFSSAQNLSEDQIETAIDLSRKAYPRYFLDEVNEDLEGLCDVIRQFGAKVLRPNISDVSKRFSSPNWTAFGCNVYNMRDLHLVVGNTVIESPSHEKFRYFEATGLYDIWYEYFKEGFKWIAGPKPKLLGDYRMPFYEDGNLLHRLAENEIVFEAANTVRMGKDLLYLVSSSGNYLGAKWLQSVLGEEYTVHTTEDIYRSSHIDSTVLCLKPGSVLLNAYRVHEGNCPKILEKWDKIYFNDILRFPEESITFQKEVRDNIHQQLSAIGIESNLGDMSSEWIGMNILSLDPDTVVVDSKQTGLIKTLEGAKLTVIPVSFRHSYFMGGIHCSTLDTVRDSVLEDYFN